MIFRLLHGGVRENLALTAIVHEWRLRNPADEVLVETSLPEIFSNNPDVKGVGQFPNDNLIIDLDVLRDPEIGIHPVDLYALAAFGDNRLLSRRMRVFVSDSAKDTPTSGQVVYVGQKFSQEHRQLCTAVEKRFVKVVTLSYEAQRLADLVTSLKTHGGLFIGCDEDMTWLAMTTDIPIVMLSGPRQPAACQAFREGVPFETVAWKCDLLDNCLKMNAANGFGNIYHVYCRKEPELACEKLVTEDDLLAAIDGALKE